MFCGDALIGGSRFTHDAMNGSARYSTSRTLGGRNGSRRDLVPKGDMGPTVNHFVLNGTLTIFTAKDCRCTSLPAVALSIGHASTLDGS